MYDRSAAPQSAVDPTSADALATLTDAVVEIWADVLEIDESSINAETSDFFELGGYSLLALQTTGRLLAAVGIDQDESSELEGLLLNQLFEIPTAAAQANCLIESLKAR